MKKLRLLLIGGIGYVLGARAGRQRYEQIRGMAMKVKSNPKVQHAAESAKEAAPVVKEKVAGAAGAAASKARRSDSSDDTATGANGVPMEESAYPNGMTPPVS
jgi:hypothetical protein